MYWYVLLPKYVSFTFSSNSFSTHCHLRDLIKILKIKLPHAIFPSNSLQIFTEFALQGWPKNSCQHWPRSWLAAWWHQAITWANVDQDPCHHMASLGHNKFKSIYILKSPYTDSAKLVSPRSSTDEKVGGPVKNMGGPIKVPYITMFKIGKRCKKLIFGPVKLEKFSRCLPTSNLD